MAGIEGPQDEHNMVHTTPQEQPQTPDTEDNSVSAEKKKLNEKAKAQVNGSDELLINGHSTADASAENNKLLENGDSKHEQTESQSDEKEKCEDEKKEEGTDQDVVLIQDTGFTVKIIAPGLEPFDLPVSSMELVQEIFQVLIDREDTCHRTCFTLQLDGVTLDNFAELKTIEGLTEGSVIKVVEEPYTVREARIHVRHVRDLLKSVDLSDSYNGIDCYSLSFLNTVTSGDILDKKKSKPDSVDCTPPDYIMPGSRERPILPLHPISKEQKAPQCVKVLTYSGWNPPPGNRKMHGDILYLYIVTLEDKRYHVTASTRGFYVNQSTQDEFNPKAAPQKHLSHSLIDLLNQISPAFKRNLAILLKKRAQKHPFERVATPYQVYSWLSPAMDHQVDSIRAEDAFSSRLGYEEHIPGQTRDWNEELQTTRELPRKNLPERLIRERAVFKVHSDFVVAATRGAMAVIDGNIMAINPGEESKMQMFLWNNIFFSLGFDVKDHYKDFGGDYAALAAPNSDLAGVRAYSSLDPEGLYTLGTVVVDYRGYRVTAQSIIPGILEREQEQSVVYGSIDFGKTVVSHEKYRELLKKTATQLKIRPHKVINEKDEEIELFSSVECKGIIGNDNRYYILDLLRTFPPDVNFLKVEGEEIELSDEVKELSFPRQHRHKLVCLRQELVDAFVENRYIVFVKHAAYQFQQLRIKRQLAAAAEKQAEEKEKKEIEENKEKDTQENKEKGEQENKENHKESETKTESEEKTENKDLKEEEIPTDDAKKIVEALTGTDSNTFETDSREIVKNAAKIVGSISDKEFNITFNPDVYQPHVNHSEPDGESLKRDKKLIRDAAEFLLLHQIPAFIKDCLEHTSSPIDGFTLTEALHHNGINMRYLGTVTTMVEKHAQLSYLHSICIAELVGRAVRHLFRTYVQGVETMNLSAAISHFLNCYLGSCPSPHVQAQDELFSKQSKKKNKKKNKSLALSSDNTEWTTETPKTLWKKITTEIQDYFNYTLTCDSCDTLVEKHSIQKVSMLRTFCQCLGVQLLLREYNMDNRGRQAFSEEDIINMFPNVKNVHPRATDAYHFFNSGQQKIQQGLLRDGYDLINEALNLLNNVYGAMHPEIAACARLLARLNYIMGDYAEALSYQQRAVLMSERVLGIDHPNTITEYFHLALYCFANNQVSNALRLMYRARYLALLCHGEHHPEIALFDSNIGLVLHAVGEFDLSLRFLQHSLELNSKFFGEKSLKVAMSYHLVARTYSCKGDFRTALQHEKEAFAIYKQQLGEEHDRTKESSECLKHLTQQAVKFQKTMNELYRGEKGITIPPIQIQYPSMASVLDTLNLINGIVFLHISPEDIEKFRSEMIRRQTAQASEGNSQSATSTPAVKSADSAAEQPKDNQVVANSNNDTATKEKEAEEAGR